jgi:serine protease
MAGALTAPAIAAPAVSTGTAHAPAAHVGTQGPKTVLWPAGSPHAKPVGRVDSGAQQLHYEGGSAGHGVETQPAVYLVFWGSQWDRTDPYAAYEQRFFRGLYGKGDDWTRSQNQYCEGVAVGAVDCARNRPHVGLPTRGGVLKGVWFDDSALAVPTDAVVRVGSSDSVAAEAVRAAAHFHNTTAAQNRNVQYLINEPTHFDSVGFGALYCAYHSWITSSYGQIAYADMPYLTDSPGCGANTVNPGAAGAYDGVSIVAGHEFLETVTDPWPSTGWVDGSGMETGDKCAWKQDMPGAMDNVHLTTGTFAVQSMWSNVAGNGHGQCVTHQR